MEKISNTTVPEINSDEITDDLWNKQQPNKIADDSDYEEYDFAERPTDDGEDSFFADFHGNAPDGEKANWNTIFVTLGDNQNKRQKI